MSSPNTFFDSGKAPGVEVWRIEDFKPVKQPAQALGRFYIGDSYVILNTTKLGGDKLSHEIFYWQGKESTQDETGASAILAEQLDASMGGRPQERREVQGEESSAFQSVGALLASAVSPVYFPAAILADNTALQSRNIKAHASIPKSSRKLFKGGIRYLSGGAASGFHHHEDAPHKATLAQIKGVRVTEVPLGLDSLNSGDVFILDLGQKIIVWAGSAATGMEKNKALTYTIALRDDRDHKGTAQVVHLEEADKEGEDAAAFYSALGVDSPASISIKAAASQANS